MGGILCNYLEVVFLPFIMGSVTNHHCILSWLLCFSCGEQSKKYHIVLTSFIFITLCFYLYFCNTSLIRFYLYLCNTSLIRFYLYLCNTSLIRFYLYLCNTSLIRFYLYLCNTSLTRLARTISDHHLKWNLALCGWNHETHHHQLISPSGMVSLG